MMSLAYSCAVNDNFLVPENQKKSPCGFPPMRFSDTFLLTPAVRHCLVGDDFVKKWGTLIIPFVSLFFTNLLSAYLLIKFFLGLKNGLKKMV